MESDTKLLKGISVIVCCYNSSERLMPTLQHLAAQQLPADVPWELVLVDNASTDATVSVAKRIWDGLASTAPMQVIAEPKPGTDHARRAGIYAARYAYFVFCDDDNWLMPDYLITGITRLNSDNKIGLLGGSGEAVADIPIPEWFDKVAGYYAACAPAATESDLTEYGIWGAGMTGRTRLVQTALHPDFPLLNAGRVGDKNGFGEDGEISMRVALQGYRIMFTPQLQYNHFMPANRLTEFYMNTLLQKANIPAQVMASYFRMLHCRKWKGLARFFFSLNHAAKYIWAKWQKNKKSKEFSTDYLFYLTGLSIFETTNNTTVRNFEAFTKLLNHAN